MRPHAEPAANEFLLPLRTRLRQETNHQIVHDSLHRREGWTKSYAFNGTLALP